MKLSKEIKTAIIVIGGIACFFIGFNFLKSRSLFRQNNIYHVIYEHSGGLKTGTPVTVNGVQIGTVESVGLDEQTAKIKVSIACTKDFLFSKNSKAELHSSLLGGTGLQIVPVFDGAPKAESGDELKPSIQMDLLQSLSSKLEPTQLKVNYLLSKSDTTLAAVNAFLNEKTIEHMKGAVANMNAVMANLNRSSAELNHILLNNKQNLQEILSNAHKMTQHLAQFTDSLAKSDLNKTLAQTQQMIANLNTMVAQIQQGKGNVGKLVNDEQLYKNLEKATKELELLLQDFRLNPKRYVHFSVFGKKAKPYEATAQEAEKAIEE